MKYHMKIFSLLAMTIFSSFPLFASSELTSRTPEGEVEVVPVGSSTGPSYPQVEEIENVNLFATPSEKETSSFIKAQGLDLSVKGYERGKKKVKPRLGLSIDGGGIRGLMPAIWLNKLEIELKEKGLKAPLYKVFDYVGGTSIGGILALGVAADIHTDILIDLFETKREEVFPAAGRRLARFIDFFGLKTHRYVSENLENLLHTQFGEITLQDVKTNVLITACTNDGHPWIFKKMGKKGKNYKIWKVARCTSAAPTYFSAYQTSPDQPWLVDGGMWINNPSTLVAASITKEYQGGQFNPENLHILSLGTGETSARAIPSSAGKLHAGAIINALMNSHNRGNHMVMSQLLGKNYQRVNPTLDQFIELDDKTDKTIATLKTYAHAEENIKLIKEFVDQSEEIVRKKLEKAKRSGSSIYEE